MNLLSSRFHEGEPPTELVIEDLIVGDGAEAVQVQRCSVHYTGWTTPPERVRLPAGVAVEPISFPLQG